MRPLLERIERLAPVAFILVAGIVGGTLQSLIDLTQHYRPISFGLFALSGAAAIVFWWLAVRRRRYSVWSGALQLTLAAAWAQLLSLAIVTPLTVPAEVHLRLRDVLVGASSAIVGLSIIRFPVAAGLVALGRFLPGGRGLPDVGATIAKHHDAVT